VSSFIKYLSATFCRSPGISVHENFSSAGWRRNSHPSVYSRPEIPIALQYAAIPVWSPSLKSESRPGALM
jgi:hypothetical protein